MAYSAKINVIRKMPKMVLTERQLPQAMSYRYQYDSAGSLTAVIGTDGKLRLHHRRLANDIETKGGAIQSYRYDALGNITGIIDGNGNSSRP